MSRYTITNNFGMCPNQIHGITDEGQHFYFRGRGGRWQLHFGNDLDESIFGPGYEGDLESAGWLEKEEWEEFFWQVIEQIENGTAQKLDVQRHKNDIEQLLVRLTTPATSEQLAQIRALTKEKSND